MRFLLDVYYGKSGLEGKIEDEEGVQLSTPNPQVALVIIEKGKPENYPHKRLEREINEFFGLISPNKRTYIQMGKPVFNQSGNIPYIVVPFNEYTRRDQDFFLNITI